MFKSIKKKILSKNNQRLSTTNEDDDDSKSGTNKNINNLTLKVDAIKDSSTGNGSSNLGDFGKNDITPVWIKQSLNGNEQQNVFNKKYF